MLTMQARKHFKLPRDPFFDDVTASADVYLTDESRFAAEYLYQTAKVGGMLTVIGESGSGKSTLRRYTLDRLRREGQKVRVISPRTIDRARLTASSICDAIIEDCSSEHPRSSLEAKGRQVERILTDSGRSGWRHVLMIEEAHDLALQTIKHLKRFAELEDGFRKLLAIVLIAQPEMRDKLDESKNYTAREVIRRMEIVDLAPLADGNEIAQYLALKLTRLSVTPERVVSPDGCDALAARLCRQTAAGTVYSVAWPLLVNGLTRRALNLAAELGADRIDAEVVGSL